MEPGKRETKWERTNVTNLIRNRASGTYYARVKVGGKQKWRTLDTSVASVAKLRLRDTEKLIRAQAEAQRGEVKKLGAEEMSVGHFIAALREQNRLDTSIAPATRERRETAIKAVVTTWPDLSARAIRRVTGSDCRQWAAKALREGTGFVAPNAKTVRKGMSGSAFNKAVDVLRAIFEIARERGVIYQNPAAEIAKQPKKKKKLELPSAAQFQKIIEHILRSPSKWSQDCADLARVLGYSGLRLREATRLRWSDVDYDRNTLSVPGTKTASSLRTIPLFPALAAALKEIQARREGEPTPASILQIGSCRGALDSACRAVGVPSMNHHDLRHLFATRCIESGVDIPTVSRWLGHSDGGTLAMETYGHLRQEHSQAQAARVQF